MNWVETVWRRTQEVMGARKWAWMAAALVVIGGLSSCSTVFPSPGVARQVAGEPLQRREMAGSPGGDAGSQEVRIWLLADSYHTSLVLPVEWLVEHGFRVPEEVRGARWVNVSWGDRFAYEQERWLTLWEVINAFVAPTPSVVEMIRVDYDPRWVFPNQRVYQAQVDRGMGPAVAAFLNHCAQPGPGGPAWVRIHDPTWGRGGLYDCPHSYGLPRLCNAFTAGALEACGFKLDPPGRIFANALIMHCKRQGFERLPPLSREEREFLAAYLTRIGHVPE